MKLLLSEKSTEQQCYNDQVVGKRRVAVHHLSHNVQHHLLYMNYLYKLLKIHKVQQNCRSASMTFLRQRHLNFIFMFNKIITVNIETLWGLVKLVENWGKKNPTSHFSQTCSSFKDLQCVEDCSWHWQCIVPPCFRLCNTRSISAQKSKNDPESFI